MGIFIPKKLFSRTTKKLILVAKIWVAGTKFCCFLKLLLTCLFFCCIACSRLLRIPFKYRKMSFFLNKHSQLSGRVLYCQTKKWSSTPTICCMIFFQNFAKLKWQIIPKLLLHWHENIEYGFKKIWQIDLFTLLDTHQHSTFSFFLSTKIFVSAIHNN